MCRWNYSNRRRLRLVLVHVPHVSAGGDVPATPAGRGKQAQSDGGAVTARRLLYHLFLTLAVAALGLVLGFALAVMGVWW